MRNQKIITVDKRVGRNEMTTNHVSPVRPQRMPIDIHFVQVGLTLVCFICTVISYNKKFSNIFE